MENKIIYNLIFITTIIFIIMPLISSDTIGDTTIKVSVYNSTKIYTNGSLTTIKVEINNSLTSYNHQIFSFNVNFIREGINLYDDFNFLFIKNETVSEDLVTKYTTCLSQKSTCELTKSQFNTAWDQCEKKLTEATGENSTACKLQVDSCNLQIKEKDLEITSKDQEIEKLTNDQTNTKNSKWFWAIGGVILGILGLLFKQGKLTGTPKDRSEEEFNRMQAG